MAPFFLRLTIFQNTGDIHSLQPYRDYFKKAGLALSNQGFDSAQPPVTQLSNLVTQKLSNLVTRASSESYRSDSFLTPLPEVHFIHSGQAATGYTTLRL